jgi:hypothetical protein
MTDSTSVPQETQQRPAAEDQHCRGWGVGTWGKGTWGTQRPTPPQQSPQEPPQEPTTS